MKRLPSGNFRFLFACTIFIASLFASVPALAQGEGISQFASDITIERNGTLTVREQITVRAEGNVIRHGIFRDFPTSYIDKLGNRSRVGFSVVQVMRGGRDEPYDVETIENGKRVRIGSADVEIEPGTHVYTIVYQTTRQIGFFPDHDELYWNVTGNGWNFVIDQVQAVVHLPEGAQVQATDFFTGPQGATEKNAQAQERTSNTIAFQTTAPLNSYEGLTIVVGFNKGVVSLPTTGEKILDFLRDNAGAAAALGGLIVLAGFYFYTWSRFGRDPERGTIVPLFAPPKNFSAAAVRFVDRMGYDRKAFAAAIIAMAVKGYLTITETDSTYTLTRTGKSPDETGLAPAERAVANALFNVHSSIELKNSNHQTVSRAIVALQTALRRQEEGVYFVTNLGWFLGGIAILVASAVATAVLLSDTPDSEALLPLGFFAVVSSFIVHRVAQAWMGVVSGSGRILDIGSAIVSTLFVIPFLAAIVFFAIGFRDTFMPLPIVAIGALVAQGILAFVFYRLLKAPTVAGAKIRDQIDGFRMFLVTAEKERLEVLHPPHVTPEVFEKFLPYAIALDAENAWSRKFEAEAQRAGQDVKTTYRPGWYSGNSFSRLGPSRFASSLGSSVAGATAAAATAPGRSSGFGGRSGGGSSGGGGGGGGGGGW